MKFLLPVLPLLLALAPAKPLPPELIEKSASEIDEALRAGQKAREITPNGIVDDATFLRRSYLRNGEEII